MFTFSLARIPVRVHISFLFMAAVLGSNNGNPATLVLWLAIVFVSVLLHELGHALVGRAFGLAPAIELHGFGGTTSWAHKQVSSGKKMLISLAGPMVGIVLGQAVALIFLRDDGGLELSRLGVTAVRYIYWVNFWWGLFNLLPILPLDGGNVLAEGLNVLTNGHGVRPARYISIVLAVPAALVSLWTGNLWIALLAGMFAYQNVRAVIGSRPRPAPPRAW